jgi:enamine deaminase RidA (YjgF/YER057c/UK114 family)
MKTIKTEKTYLPGLYVISLPRPFGTEYFITATPDKGESALQLCERAAEYAEAHNAAIISLDIFRLQNNSSTGIFDKHGRSLSQVNWPITWFDDNYKHDVSGTYVWAVKGADVTPIHFGNRIAGSIVEDEFTRFVRLGGFTANGAGQTSQQQTREVLEQMDAVLHTAKMDFSDVIRTWFYNHNITSWYKEFNLVRNTFFRERNVFSSLIPASTAVGKRNNSDAAVVGGCLAVQGKRQKIQEFALPSPLQNSAMEYGSSFSRAIELALPDHRRLFISGTASIEPNGKTIYPDDASAQIRRTMEVIYAILKSRKMEWSDIARSIAYFKNAEDAKLLQDYCRMKELPSFPVIAAQCDICRDDLLFEIEVDAIN